MQATQAPVCTISGVHDWPISKVKNAPNESRAACSVQRAACIQLPVFVELGRITVYGNIYPPPLPLYPYNLASVTCQPTQDKMPNQIPVLRVLRVLRLTLSESVSALRFLATTVEPRSVS